MSKLLIIPTLVLCLAVPAPEQLTFRFNHENVLGTSFELKVDARSESVADLAENTALNEIDRLDKILSTYQDSSEVTRWLTTMNTDQEVSPELFEVLSLFDYWQGQTHGALNPSAAVASELWRQASEKQRLPDAKEVSEVLERMKADQWELDEESGTATHLSNEPIVLNSFVKSYIINKVADAVMDLPGVSGVVANIGGDMVVRGDHTENIRIANPRTDAENSPPIATILVHNKAVATSGNYRRGFQVSDNWFSHILDARTALPASGIISATVVADRATDAGALATAFNILTPAESAELASRISGIEYQVIDVEGRQWVSAGWANLLNNVSDNDIAMIRQADHEAKVELELPQFEGRFRRPFVAVWIEDGKRESIRTLAIWYNKPRWLPDLKRWFSKNQNITQDPNAIGSLSSATRSAGKYSLVWDGLDDAGVPAKPGKYTIYIEAAREHGTYQLIKQVVDWNGKPSHFDLDGGVEISSASIDVY